MIDAAEERRTCTCHQRTRFVCCGGGLPRAGDPTDRDFTDYVFDGDLDRPYLEADKALPKTVYGQSKLAGEQAILSVLPTATIVRIAWLYGQGGPSFFHTMHRLLADAEASPLRVVDDQRGSPTSCDAVATVLAGIIESPLPGIVHGACTGETTWFGFTQAIRAAYGFSRGIEPCTTDEYLPAPRPHNSVLEPVLVNAGRPVPQDWQSALNDFVRKYPNG